MNDLLVDIGNSRIKCALLPASGARGEVQPIELAHAGWREELSRRVAASGVDGGAWLASVAPAEVAIAATDVLVAAGLSVHIVETRAVQGRLRIAYDDPSRLGVDRFLALLGASERDDGPWLLVSAGSALTADLLDREGLHHGGMIATMPADARSALARRFRQLDVDGGVVVDFARNTADAVATGVHAAAQGMVELALRNAVTRLGEIPTLLVSGGAASLFSSITGARIVQVPSLVLDGLAAFARAGDERRSTAT